jgi:uncharacterized protein with GYD domain
MPKYLFMASYGPEGAKGVQSKGGTARRDVISQLAENLGGSVESFYFAFGEHDVYTIIDLPDHETATALALAVNSSGSTTLRTVVLLTPEEVDRAADRTVEYRPPGA